MARAIFVEAGEDLFELVHRVILDAVTNLLDQKGYFSAKVLRQTRKNELQSLSTTPDVPFRPVLRSKALRFLCKQQQGADLLMGMPN